MAVIGIVLLFLSAAARAEEKEENIVHALGQITVTGENIDNDIYHIPEKTIINIDSYESAGVVQNVADILKDQAIIDFRGASDLVPGDLVNGDDTISMRGFGSNRFGTAMDGLSLRKSGGRNTVHVVDYSLIPPFMIEKVEVMPGPHSALYQGKSIGGVVNIITRIPEKYELLKPDITLLTSYKSYNTQNHSLSLHGGAGPFIYDAGFQEYATDGYLRNAGADIDTVFGRIGYILPSDAYLTLMASHTDAERNIPVNNHPDSEDYHGGYPVVESSSYSQWQSPKWNESATSLRLNYHQPSPIGIWNMNAFYCEENWEKNISTKMPKGFMTLPGKPNGISRG